MLPAGIRNGSAEFEQIVKRSEWDRSVDFPTELGKAREDGLCLSVSGGKMGKGVLLSNSVAAPLFVTGEELLLHEVATD